LIVLRTEIGYGAPQKQGTFEAHGSPLGPEELQAAKAHLGWPLEPSFLVAAPVLAHFRTAGYRGADAQRDWNARFAAYRQALPGEGAACGRALTHELRVGGERAPPPSPADAKGLATRKASEGTLQALARTIPELVGGSADLNPSTLTWLKGFGD